MKIDVDVHKDLKRRFGVMEEDRQPWLSYWEELAEYILPRRIVFDRKMNGPQAQLRNGTILDGTGTSAAHILAAGMLNGITSPARPWFRLKIGLENELREWLDEAQFRMQAVIANSNFYNSMASFYTDLSVFANTCMLVYEDDEDVFRCYMVAVGEFMLRHDERGVVAHFGRRFKRKLADLVSEFGEENLPDNAQIAWRNKNYKAEYEVCHIIEPNKGTPTVAKIHKFREVYWIDGAPQGEVLRVRGFREAPMLAGRWEILGSDTYATGPSSDALPDIKQLQHMTKRKAQAIDKMVNPPVMADMALKSQPMSMLPNSITYVSSTTSVGVKPIMNINPPLAEMSQDMQTIQVRIREFFHNDLFRMISQLEAVRTATEIDARREEKLILLGPVLGRLSGEVLDMFLTRVFNIMLRRGLFPPLPQGMEDADIAIEYVSILHDAQRMVGAAPIERYVAFLGNLAGVIPDVLEIPEWTELVLGYGEILGVPAKYNKSKDEVQQTIEQAKQGQGMAAAAETALPAAQSAKLMSETEVGGGANLLQTLMGG